MRHIPVIAFLALLVCSCATTKHAPTVVTTRDSIVTETHYELIERVDTVYVTLPAETAERTTPDTTSTLENTYAKSTASILPNGLLFHNLETKPQPVPVPVKNSTERRDSIMERRIEVPVPYPVETEVNVLTWWQQAQIYGFRVVVALLAIFALVRYRKRIFAIVRRFI